MFDPEDPDFRMKDWPLYWLIRVNQTYERALEQGMRHIEMDVPSWRVLMILNELGEASVSTIADHASIKLPTMTKIVGRMENSSLVETYSSSSDRRVTMVKATELGREKTALVRRHAARTFRTAFQDIPDKEIHGLNAVLQKLYANLSNDPR